MTDVTTNPTTQPTQTNTPETKENTMTDTNIQATQDPQAQTNPKEEEMTNSTNPTKEVNFAQKLAAHGAACAKQGHEVGKHYLMVVMDSANRVIGFEKDSTPEGVMSKLTKYGKAAVYYTVYAVMAIPSYISGVFIGFVAGLFGRKIDYTKVAEQLSQEETVVEQGTVNP